MATFAELDNSNRVLRVLGIDDKNTRDENGNEVESIGAKYLHDGFGGTWKQTSFNTLAGVHKLGGTPFRKNAAGSITSVYDEVRDAFRTPQPYPLWTLNEDTCQWEPPIPYPDAEFDSDGVDISKPYRWDIETEDWIVRDIPNP
jgi:hypothetical protein